MTAGAPMSSGSILGDPAHFSLVLGGPLYQVLLRGHVEGNAPRIVATRIVVFVLIAWLPPLLLSAVEGHLSSAGAAVPFLSDVEVQTRFLVALPLLLVAELVVHLRMRPLLQLFLVRKLIPESAVTEFHAAIAAAMRLRNSVLAEVLLVIFAYGVGVLVVWRHYLVLGAPTWYATPSDGGTNLSLAGTWYGYVSLPLVQFLLLRWYFRLLIWTRLLWRVSRIELRLLPAHPDRLGGLGFIANTVYALAPLAAAHGALLAGLLANRILYAGAALVDFKVEIGVVVIFVLCWAVGPLLVFTPQLSRAKRLGNVEYGTLAEQYVRAFDAKWLRDAAPAEEPLMGSADIQSLADLGNSVEVIGTMRIVPITRDALLRLVATTLAPVVPLALTIMPLEELLKLLFGILF